MFVIWLILFSPELWHGYSVLMSESSRKHIIIMNAYVTVYEYQIEN